MYALQLLQDGRKDKKLLSIMYYEKTFLLI